MNSDEASGFQLRVGIAGLGVASSQVLPAFGREGSPYVLAGGADVRPEAREQFVKVFPNEYRRALTELADKNSKMAA